MANTDGVFFHLSETCCICAWGRVVQNAAPPERQSNADFFTQPAVQMLQWLMFIYSPVVNVQISALSLSSIKLVFYVHSLVLSLDSRLLLAGADLSPRVVNVLSAPWSALSLDTPPGAAKVPALCCRLACGACSTCHTQTAASQHNYIALYWWAGSWFLSAIVLYTHPGSYSLEVGEKPH